MTITPVKERVREFRLRKKQQGLVSTCAWLTPEAMLMLDRLIMAMGLEKRSQVIEKLIRGKFTSMVQRKPWKI